MTKVLDLKPKIHEGLQGEALTHWLRSVADFNYVWAVCRARAIQAYERWTNG